MSTLRRFRGSIAALAVLAVAGIAWFVVDAMKPEVEVYEAPPGLFDFEKEDMVAVRVVRQDVTIELVEEDGEWKVVGEPWRPSRSMVRRVAHQLHDLTARAVVAEGQDREAVELYGMGEDAIQVTLTLKDGSTIAFEAGDPNPTSVSYYIRPIPGDSVYVVKKSAVDYYRLSLEEFRERRFAWLDADDADRIDATVDGRRMVFSRVDDKYWRMNQPKEQDAARDQVRTMLGRTGALKAFGFVSDAPTDEERRRYGLEPAEHTVAIGMSSGEVVTLKIGSLVPDSDPLQRYVLRVEDNAIYAARDGFLEAFQLSVEEYRRRRILRKHEWDVQKMRVVRGDDEVELHRTSDGWRWPDGAPVSGSTPKRLAGRVADAKAMAFHDDVPDRGAFGLEPPFATVDLTFEDGARVAVVGNELEVEVEDRPYPEKRRYFQVDGDATVYEVEGSVGSVVDDVFREYGRKLERDADKRVQAGVEGEGDSP